MKYKRPLPPCPYTYDEGGFLATADPTEGRSSKHVFKECVSNSNYMVQKHVP
jgi:hypothetical protein